MNLVIFKYGKSNKLTHNFEDRITALERKSIQGATLSPVKLWSGILQSNTSTNITNLSKYGIVECIFRPCGFGNAIYTALSYKNSHVKVTEDQGEGRVTTVDIYRDQTDKITLSRDITGFWELELTEVWGIG